MRHLKPKERHPLIPRKLCMITILIAFSITQPLFAQSNQVPVWTLEQCLDTALQHNPQLQAMHYTVQESQERIQEARSGFFPWVSFSMSANRYNYENASGGRIGFTNRENYQAGINARYPVFEGFRTVASHTAAKANYQASQAQYRQNRFDLILDVTDSYYRLLQAERLVKVAEKSVERTRLHLDFANARFENGLASRSDVLKAKVEQSNADLALIRARNNRLSVKGRLNVLMGRPAQTAISIQDDMESRMFHFPADSLTFQIDIDHLVDAAFQSRPELVRLDQQVRAQQAAIRIARSDYFLTLSLDGNYTYVGETPSELSGTSFLGVSLSVPLFNGFARPARTAQEKWLLQNLQQQRKTLQHQISLEVWNAYLGVKEAYERIQSNEIFYENALENLRIAEGEYKEGVGSMLDVIDAETALVTAEESYIESLADFQIARAELERAVGKKELEEMIQ